MTSILRENRNFWRSAQAEDSGVIIDAADYYFAFYEAAGAAKRYILMSGWQFDTGVKLIRGDDARAGEDARFLPFLHRLLAQTPELEVYILAWDFHPVLLGEREWLQRWRFALGGGSRLHFRFDECPIAGGSHHQKFVVIDGVVAFVGGIDVCEARWDDRRHVADNPARLSRGHPQKPYHDVQAFVCGSEAAGAVAALFTERWERCTDAEPLELPATVSGAVPAVSRASVSLGPARIALSRTDPRDDDDIVREVEHLFVDAIRDSERLIYIETQYFSSQKIFEALVRRMHAAERSKPQIVILVNERAEAPKEEIAVGLRQAQNFVSLRRIAAENGVDLGIYYPLCAGANDAFRTTYLHSKIMLVDDRFFTVGSANMTNRSMALDSELHVSWESGSMTSASDDLAAAIASVRVELLCEHARLTSADDVKSLHAIERLVAFLDSVAQRSDTRLRAHGPPSEAQQIAMDLLDPRDLPFDQENMERDSAAAHSEPVDEPVGWGQIHIPSLSEVARHVRDATPLRSLWHVFRNGIAEGRGERPADDAPSGSGSDSNAPGAV